MSPDLLELSEAASAPLSSVGGKARTLGRLMRAGFRVPPGVVIPPSSYFGDEEASMLHELGSGPFAVRSSGVGEDGAEKSLAGRYQTLLGVERESLAQGITTLRESARGEDGEPIPVLIQRMIHPVCAGVAFTADPVSGDRSQTIVTGTRGLADRLLSGQVTGDEWTVRGTKIRPTRRPERVLGRRLVRRIAHLADRIAVEFGGPQDIEWAWDGRELWVVQARPITALPDEVSWDPPAPGVYHRSLRLGEWIPEPVSPLFESWLVTRMERRIHAFLFDEIGQVAPEPLHVVVNGWYFYSVNWMPAPGVAFGRNFLSILRRMPKDWRKAAAMFPQTIRFGYQPFEDEWRRELLPRYRSQVAEAERRVDSLAPRELMEMVDGLADLAGSYFASIAVVAGAGYKFEVQLAQFWNRHLRQRIGLSHMVLLQGLEQSQESVGAPRLETLDWVRPPLAPGPVPANLEALATQRAETERKAAAALARSPRKLARFQRILAAAQHVMPVREEQLSLLSLPWPVMRRAVERLGQVLEASGCIDSADDVFFLRRAEIDALLDNPEDMRDVVDSRRTARERASRLVAPLMVGRIPPAVRFLFSYSARVFGARHSDEAIVHGVPASPGRATGPVRVVLDSSRFQDLEEGEILVAPLTAPAWSDLFSRAAAVVTDVGSALAHASIIAREYGIPAVVGCGDATSRLRDGQMVTVDGSTGNVELAISKPAAVVSGGRINRLGTAMSSGREDDGPGE